MIKQAFFGVAVFAFFFSGCADKGGSEAMHPESALEITKVAEPDRTITEAEVPNFDLRIIFDEDQAIPPDNSLTIMMNGEPVPQMYENGHLRLALKNGTYDIQINSEEPRTAFRRIFTVQDDQNISETIFLKSEALALLGDYKIKFQEKENLDKLKIIVVGMDQNIRPVDTLSMILVTPIQAGSFVENVGGTDIGDSEIVTDKFTIDDGLVTLSNPTDFDKVIKTLGAAPYEVEISLYDSVNDKSYEGVLLLK